MIEQALFELLSRINCCKRSSVFDILAVIMYSCICLAIVTTYHAFLLIYSIACVTLITGLSVLLVADLSCFDSQERRLPSVNQVNQDLTQ